METAELMARFRPLGSSQIGDAMHRLNIVDGDIRPVWKSIKLVGIARTVLTAAGDNKAIHDSLADLQTGEVLVVNGQGVTHRALVGELIAMRAQKRGCVGFVIDGAVRDSSEFQNLDFPVYARGVSPAGPYRHGPGAKQVPVAIGSVVVQPGDILVGDDDGLAVISRANAESVLEASEQKLAQEKLQIQEILQS